MKKRYWVSLTVPCVVIAVGWIALHLASPIRIYEGKSTSRLTFDRNDSVLDIQVAADGRYRSPISLDDVPKACIEAALKYEDRRFYSHPGVDPFSILRAAASFGTDHRSGGSTITMQVVRLRTGLNTKRLRGKFRQIWEALVLERHRSKREILEAYFNFAPYGGGLEGIAAASAVYFGKIPARLSPMECAALAVLPQQPTERFGFRGKRFTDALERLTVSLGLPQGQTSINLPSRETFEPSHLARHLTSRVMSSGGVARTTIDKELQRETEGALALYVKGKESLGLRNGALLIADAESGEILSYVASNDYSDSSIRGFVDGITSRRSPGSVLKPFVYAEAIAEGIIVPESVVTDIPVKLTAYEPENFERNFLGLITAREALVKSRNIPAILLNSKLEDDGLFTLLQRANVPLSQNADYYGAAVVVGGIEVSLFDVVRLYTALATDGTIAVLHATGSSASKKRMNLISPESAFLTREMLKTNPSPPGFSMRGIAWKTGTSSGGRDAWAVGVKGKIVVGVWLGNFDGTPNSNFIGRDLAGPLLFDVIEKMRHIGSYRKALLTETHRHELNLKYTTVCAKSGMAATENCPHHKKALVIPGVSPIERCNIHRNGTEGEAIYPSEVSAHFYNVGVNLSPTAPKITAVEKQPPRIVSPEQGVEYRAEYGKETEIELRANVDGESREVFWYVDGALIGQTVPGRSLFWKAHAGASTIRAIDSFGQSDAVKVKVAVQEG